MSFRPSGVFSAQWLPVDTDGRLDREALAEHLAFERRAGVRGLLALGSTGQFPLFSPDERKGLLAAIAELAGDMPVIANITDIQPNAAIALGREAKALGLPAVALMPPCFYPLAQDDILAYFLRVAEAVDLPVMLYNFPELAGKKIELTTLAAFADRAPLVAIKQSGGEFGYHRELVALGRQKNFAVMSGADTRLPEVFKLGAAGCIGGLVNFVPEWMVAIDRICREAQPSDYATPAAALVEVGKIVDRLTFPMNIGAGLEARGFRPGAPRFVVSPRSRELHTAIVADLRRLFARHGLVPAAAA